MNVEASVPDPRVSVFSFSGVPDDLGQWRGYGTSSGAYALVFNGPELKSRLPLIPLVRCEYRLAQQREIIRGWIANVVAIAKRRIPHGEAALKDGMQYLLLVELFSRMAPALKNEAFDAEHEWRMIAHPRMPGVSESVRGTASGLRPTIKIQLDEHMSACLRRVVVGPMPDQKREMLAVERLLSLLTVLVPGASEAVRRALPNVVVHCHSEVFYPRGAGRRSGRCGAVLAWLQFRRKFVVNAAARGSHKSAFRRSPSSDSPEGCLLSISGLRVRTYGNRRVPRGNRTTSVGRPGLSARVDRNPEKSNSERRMRCHAIAT